MAALTDQQQSDLYAAVMNLQGYLWKGGPTVNAGTGDPGTVFGRVLRMDRLLTGAQGTAGSLVEKVAALGSDSPGVVEMLRPLIAEAVAAGMAADNEDQADEIVNRLAERLGNPA